MKKAKLKIGIFSTSSPIFGKKTKNTYRFLESKGVEVYEHPQCRKKYDGHLAGSLEDRTNAIYELLRDKSINVLMAFWGGANTNQILPYLDFELIKRIYKPIIGFSDTTALLLAIQKMTGQTTYFGPAGITFTKPEPVEYTWNYFKQFFIDNLPEIVVKDSSNYADDFYFLRKPPGNKKRIIKKTKGRSIFRHGNAKGKIVAANLQTLLVLAGTDYFPDLEGKVLFIEEAEEESVAMIHRYFTHLSQVVDLKKLEAVCIGRMCEQSGFKKMDSLEMILWDVFEKIDIPIIYNLDFGHTDPMFIVPNGGSVEINTKLELIKFTI